MLLYMILTQGVFAMEKLYPFRTGNFWGYINKEGKEIIPAQFRVAQSFSEGLAAVRLNGTYGYIDVTGKLVVNYQFDYALPFQSGLAKVFKKGKVFFIDTRGSILFEHNFKRILQFKQQSYTFAATASNHFCVIDRRGNLLTDTLFDDIEPFKDGIAVVYRKNRNHTSKTELKNEKLEHALIDSTGNFLIPFGVYTEIRPFNGEFTVATRYKMNDSIRSIEYDVIIDKKGIELFEIDTNTYFSKEEFKGFSNGVEGVVLTCGRGKNAWRYNSCYYGIVDKQGKLIHSDTNWKRMTCFQSNVAFVEDGNQRLFMINNRGERVGDSSFTSILFERNNNSVDEVIVNGYAIVKGVKRWYKMDTSGVLTEIKDVTVEKFNNSFGRREGDEVLLFEPNLDKSRDNFMVMGVWNVVTKRMIEPTYDYIFEQSLSEELIRLVKNDLIHYFSQNGELVWKESKVEKTTNTSYFVDSKEYTSYCAYGKYAENNSKHSSLKRYFRNKIRSKYGFPTDSLSIVLDLVCKDTTNYGTNAFRFYIVNATKRSIEFYTSYGGLDISVQAKNESDEWQDIEFEQEYYSCGSSFSRETLPKNRFWVLRAPIYEGEIKTKMRIRLSYSVKNELDESGFTKKQIYSKEYDGSINPGQFWVKNFPSMNGEANPIFE